MSSAQTALPALEEDDPCMADASPASLLPTLGLQGANAEEADIFQCTLCLATCAEPVTGTCGEHSFCLPCLRTHLLAQQSRGETPACPTYRLPSHADPTALRVNLMLRAAIAARQAQLARSRASARRRTLKLPVLPAAAAAPAPAPAPLPPLPVVPPAAQLAYHDLVLELHEGAPVELPGQGTSSARTLAATYHHQLVAVRQLVSVTPPALAALQREALLHSSISHHNVVRVLGLASDTATDPAHPIHALVSARMWRSLQGVLEEAHRTSSAGGASSAEAAAAAGAALPIAWRLHALHQATEGLAHLHARRVAHGDLRPANLLLAAPEQGFTLKLTGFGVARVTAGGGPGGATSIGGCGSGSSSSGGVIDDCEGNGDGDGDDGDVDDVGSSASITAAAASASAVAAASEDGICWMAPELLAPLPSGALSARPPSLLTDVYSWGILAWQVLACAPLPFTAAFMDGEVGQGGEEAHALFARAVQRGARPDLAALPAGVTPELRALIEDCWAPREELAGSSAGEGSSSSSSSGGASFLPPRRHRRRPATAGVVLERLLAAAPDPGPTPSPLLTPPPPVVYTHALAPWVPRALPASRPAPRACPVCDAPPADCPYLQLQCSSAHLLCMSCSLRTLREELTPEAVGLRCPLCVAGAAGAGGGAAGGVSSSAPSPAICVSSAAFLELAAWSRSPSRHLTGEDALPASPLRPISDDELRRHERMEAGATALVMGAMMRQCPRCGTGVSRPRGHHCHHISPGTGCTTCHAHFCIQCGVEYAQNSTGHCATPGCSLFCSLQCACPDCLDCRPGAPCGTCSEDGNCWSCHPENRSALTPTLQALDYQARAYAAAAGVMAAEVGRRAAAATPEGAAEAARAAAAAAAAAAAPWACPTCTLDNDSNDFVCSACGGARPPAAPAPAAAAAAASLAPLPGAWQPPPPTPLPGMGPARIVEIMLGQAGSAAVQEAGARELEAILKRGGGSSEERCLAAGAAPALVAALQQHTGVAVVAERVCRALDALCGSQGGQVACVEAGAAGALVAALQAQAGEDDVVEVALSALESLCFIRAGGDACVSAGVVPQLLSVMARQGRDSAYMAEFCCRVLVNLTGTRGPGGDAARAASMGAGATIPAVCALLAVHAEAEGLVEHACWVLGHLGGQPGACAAMAAAGAFPAITAALALHGECEEVVEQACEALNVAAEAQPEVCVREGVLPALVAALRAHGSVAGIAESALQALYHAALRCKQEVVEAGAVPLLAAAMDTFPSGQAHEAAEAALGLLGYTRTGRRLPTAAMGAARCVELMVAEAGDAEVGEAGALALRDLSQGGHEAAAQCLAAGAPQALVAALQGPLAAAAPTLAKLAAWALSNLAAEEGGAAACLAAGAVPALVSALLVHGSCKGVTKEACWALARLSGSGAGAAACLGAGAIPALVGALRAQGAVKGTAEQACRALLHLAARAGDSPTPRAEMLAAGAVPLLVAARRAHSGKAGAQAHAALHWLGFSDKGVALLGGAAEAAAGAAADAAAAAAGLPCAEWGAARVVEALWGQGRVDARVAVAGLAALVEHTGGTGRIEEREAAVAVSAAVAAAAEAAAAAGCSGGGVGGSSSGCSTTDIISTATSTTAAAATTADASSSTAAAAATATTTAASATAPTTAAAPLTSPATAAPATAAPATAAPATAAPATAAPTTAAPSSGHGGTRGSAHAAMAQRIASCLAAGAAGAVVAALAAHTGSSAEVAEQGAIALRNLCSTSAGGEACAAQGGVAALVAVLRAHAASAAVCREACWALGNLVAPAAGVEAGLKAGMVPALVSLLGSAALGGVPEVVEVALVAVSNLCRSSAPARAACLEAGAIPVVMEALTAHGGASGTAALAAAACAALGDVARGSAPVQEACIAAGAIPAIVAALNAHGSSSAEAGSEACQALGSIVDGPAAQAACLAADAIAAIAGVLTARPGGGRSADAIRHACRALSCVIWENEAALQAAMDVGVVPALVAALKVGQQQAREEMAEQVCWQLANMALRSTSVRAEACEAGAAPVLTALLRSLTAAPAALEQACRAVAALCSSSEGGRGLFLRAGAVGVLVAALRSAGAQDLGVVRSAASALYSLSRDRDGEAECMEEGAAPALVGALGGAGGRDPKAVTNICTALASLAWTRAEYRAAIVGAGAVPALAAAFAAHSGEARERAHLALDKLGYTDVGRAR